MHSKIQKYAKKIYCLKNRNLKKNEKNIVLGKWKKYNLNINFLNVYKA